MKSLFVAVIFIISLSMTQAQEHKPELLKKPANWEFERFNLPPEFAPAITYKGTEELRFAPGMFHKDSTNYFTYVFVVQLENVSSISQTDVHHYLLNYYRGLCRVTAKDRKLTIDTSQIKVTVEKQSGLSNSKGVYNATANIFGVFADGAPVKLNIEVKVLSANARQKTYLLIIASPKEKSAPIWQMLYRIQKEFTIPGD